MILKMVLGLMQSILSFVLGLLPLPDVPAWLVELTETILGYMKTGMGIVLFFRPSGCRTRGFRPCYFNLDRCPYLQISFMGTSKNPHAGHRIAEGPHSSIGK